ncbi:MAG: Fe-S cluster assembly ATPase SufC, partial [Legionellaceae bacterium]|nr:Fe-S cluster assembly ATPase SufC [Legionellaceae bacterium]
AGHPDYQVQQGSITFQGQDLLPLAPEVRAGLGVFLSFQYPIEIPGVVNIQFLKASVNAIRTAQGKPILDAIQFLTFIREKCALLDIDESFLYRNLNEGFSGGEKKRNEILQMAALEPTLAILDETDSGLDIDALRIIADGVNTMRSPDRSIILVTHYQRLLDYIVPDYVHVLVNGRILRSGDKSLAHTLEEKGYAWLEGETSE